MSNDGSTFAERITGDHAIALGLCPVCGSSDPQFRGARGTDRGQWIECRICGTRSMTMFSKDARALLASIWNRAALRTTGELPRPMSDAAMLESLVQWLERFPHQNREVQMDLRRIAGRLRALDRTTTGWQPISTAQETLRNTILWNGVRRFVGWLSDDGWHDATNVNHNDYPEEPQPTHWHPWPEPPLPSSASGHADPR